MSPRNVGLLLLALLVVLSLAACGPVGEVISQAQAPTAAGEAPPTTADLPDGDAGRAVRLLAAQPEVAAFLADYADWEAEAWQEHEQGDIWSVDLYSQAADEWLGYGIVDLGDGTIVEFFVPRELTADEFQAGRERVEKFVLHDAEVLALLGDPDQWEHEVEYDRWEAQWYVWFNKGLDEWIVYVELYDDGAELEIVDPNVLEAEQEQQWLRDQAIELAYEAERVDEALAGVDHWRTYVEHQDGSQWTVSFVADGEELFYALVDVEAWQVLDYK